jgi:hypothetical protein
MPNPDLPKEPEAVLLTSQAAEQGGSPLIQSMPQHRHGGGHALALGPEACLPGAPLLQLAGCLPYAIRALQCVQLFAASRGAARAQLANAAKYAAALPALVLGAQLQHDALMSLRSAAGLPLGSAAGVGGGGATPTLALLAVQRHVWLVAAVVSSCFSLYWDIEQDWGMPWVAAGFSSALGRGELRAHVCSITGASGILWHIRTKGHVQMPVWLPMACNTPGLLPCKLC